MKTKVWHTGVVLMAVLAVFSTSSWAQISSSGSVTPAPTSPSWIGSSINATIGATGAGNLTLSDGGTISIRTLAVGDSAAGDGRLDVTGGNLTTSSNFILARYANATMTVSGGAVSASLLTIGSTAAANGTLLISGGEVYLSSSFSASLVVGLSGSGSVTISGNGTVRTSSSGGLRLGGAASGNGRVEVLDGGVIDTAYFVRGSGSASVLIDGGALRMSRNQPTLFSGFEAGDIVFGDSGATIDTRGFSVATAAVLSGNGSLTKKGSGTLTLSGANLYDGGTIVAEGALLMNNTTGSGTGSGPISVAAGAVLGGSGSLSGNASIAGTLAPGGNGSISSLSATNVAFSVNSTLSIEINSAVASSVGADVLIVDGDLDTVGVTYLGIRDIAATPVALPIGTRFALVNFTGTWSGGVLTFGSTGLEDGDIFTAGLNTWEITYGTPVGGENFTGDYKTGSFITLTAVPEPGTWTLFALGTLFAVWQIRCRRRRSRA